MSPSVIAFPLHRQHTLVSGIAGLLGAKHGEDATLFWRQTARDLLRQLGDNGVDPKSAENEVRSLLYAVIAQMEESALKAQG